MSDPSPTPVLAPAETDCLVCGQRGFDRHLDILLRCRSCGFVTAPRDAGLDVQAIYEGDYFTGEEYLDYAADEPLFRRTFRRRLEQIRRRVPSGRLLEVGAAYGFFLEMARAHYDVIGFELNRRAVEFARTRFDVDVRTGDFLAADPDSIGGPVDVAVMWDVIEHLERPDAFIAHLARLSRPGALLMLTTGDIGSMLARLRGRKWRLIHPPSHLHYFDRRTITRLLARHGYRVIDSRAVGVARSVRQILYSVLVLGLRRPGLYRRLGPRIPAAWGFTLNTYDIMQVTAVREQ
jgi:SAM-dependent methyltransferase